MYVIVFMCIVAIAVLGYVRFSFGDPARWHVPIAAMTSQNMVGGAIRVTAVPPDALARVDVAARQMPRTRAIAGSAEAGRITYVTRSKWIGFPDYTTIEYNDGLLKMHARLRFGRSDFGVNRERLERLLVAIQER